MNTSNHKISFFNFNNYLVVFSYHFLGFLLFSFVFLTKFWQFLQNLVFLAVFSHYIIDSTFCHFNLILSPPASFLFSFLLFSFLFLPSLLLPSFTFFVLHSFLSVFLIHSVSISISISSSFNSL